MNSLMKMFSQLNFFPHLQIWSSRPFRCALFPNFSALDLVSYFFFNLKQLRCPTRNLAWISKFVSLEQHGMRQSASSRSAINNSNLWKIPASKQMRFEKRYEQACFQLFVYSVPWITKPSMRSSSDMSVLGPRSFVRLSLRFVCFRSVLRKSDI